MIRVVSEGDVSIWFRDWRIEEDKYVIICLPLFTYSVIEQNETEYHRAVLLKEAGFSQEIHKKNSSPLKFSIIFATSLLNAF